MELKSLISKFTIYQQMSFFLLILTVYEIYPEEKKSQKAKGRYSVYKAGGSRRTRMK